MIRQIIYLSCGIIILTLLTSCPSPNLQATGDYTLFRLNRAGTWQWVKTVTPTQTLTPQLIGHIQALKASQFDTLTFYQDQRIIRRLFPDQSTNLTNEIDPKSKTMLTSYLDSTKLHRYYIKFFFDVSKDATTMQTSAPLVYLNPEYDTIRIYYQKK